MKFDKTNVPLHFRIDSVLIPENDDEAEGLLQIQKIVQLFEKMSIDVARGKWIGGFIKPTRAEMTEAVGAANAYEKVAQYIEECIERYTKKGATPPAEGRRLL